MKKKKAIARFQVHETIALGAQALPIAINIVSLGIVLGIFSSNAIAQIPHKMNAMQLSQSDRAGQFQPIEQPLRNKIIVTVGGLGLIGLELWWFLLSKPKSRQITTQREIN
ncbi:MAG: hypothetical protein ACRC2R_05210 [Xenococcaceae cyanobacterium]